MSALSSLELASSIAMDGGRFATGFGSLVTKRFKFKNDWVLRCMPLRAEVDESSSLFFGGLTISSNRGDEDVVRSRPFRPRKEGLFSKRGFGRESTPWLLCGGDSGRKTPLLSCLITSRQAVARGLAGFSMSDATNRGEFEPLSTAMNTK